MNARVAFLLGVFLITGDIRLFGAGAGKTPIEVQVEVAEINHAKAANLGIEWPNEVSVAEKTPAGVLAVGSVGRSGSLQANLHLLIEEGAAELLANPNLITDSGTVATFHAGGELPYITTSGLGTSHVEFKPYGVALTIEPKLMASGFIEMKIRAQVSAPDPVNGVILSGNSVPALSEREVTSNVTMTPGATMTLAGLVQTRDEKTVRGVPILQRIPLLGGLFRWTKRNVSRTSVIVFVTPRVSDL